MENGMETEDVFLYIYRAAVTYSWLIAQVVYRPRIYIYI